MKKLFPLLIVLILASLVLGACQQAATEEPVVEPTEEAVVEPTEEPTEEPDMGPEPGALGTEENPIIWVLVPSQDTETVLAGAEEIAASIEEQTGLVVVPLVTTDFTSAVEAMCNGEAQMGALNTFNYVLASARGCADVALASVRFGSTFYSGQLITRADSGITSVADLAGKTFCRPDPTSTSGWVIPSITMQSEGIDPENDLAEIVDAGGHDGVVIAVYNGDCDAGSTFVDARSNVEEDFPDVMDQVVVIQESAPIPNDTISIHPDVSADVREALVGAFVTLAGTEDGLAILNAVYSWSGVEVVEDSFYDGFRQQLEAAGLVVDDLFKREETTLGTEDDPIVWVLVPSQDTETVLSGAEEIAASIEESTGLVVVPLVTTDFTSAVEAMCNGEAHMGALNTFNYVLASARGCADVALASVRFGSTFYSGQIITRADSGITSIADLAGKTFCRPDPTSTSGWVIPSIAMRAAGIDPENDLAEIVDAGGHDGVVIAVYNGDCDAGSTFVDARGNVEEEFPDVMDQVIVIEESAPIPNDTISIHPDVPTNIRSQLVGAFLDLAGSEEGLAILNSVYSWSGVQIVDDDFYDGFRQQLEAAGLNIEDLIAP